MGFENLMSYEADASRDVLGLYNIDGSSLKLEFVSDPKESKVWGPIADQVDWFENHGIAYNSHYWSIDPAKFETDQGLKNFYKVTSVAKMPDSDKKIV